MAGIDRKHRPPKAQSSLDSDGLMQETNSQSSKRTRSPDLPATGPSQSFCPRVTIPAPCWDASILESWHAMQEERKRCDDISGYPRKAMDGMDTEQRRTSPNIQAYRLQLHAATRFASMARTGCCPPLADGDSDELPSKTHQVRISAMAKGSTK